MAMNYEDLPETEQLRYMIVPDQQFSDIYAVEQKIKEGVAELRDADQLTEDAVLAKIKNALKPYESKPSVLRTLQLLYKHEDDVVSARVNVNQRVYKYDINETGSRVALLFSDDNGGTQNISVYAETLRGNWECIRNMLDSNAKNIYLIDSGKKLAVVYEAANYVAFHDLDVTNDNLNLEILMKEVRKKHKKKDSKCLGDDDYSILSMESRLIGKSTGRWIEIKQSGFSVCYTPRLKEIARYLVQHAQQTQDNEDDE